MDISRQFILFAIVGSVGFAIDASLLTLLANYCSVNLYLSRVVSFAFASLGTWLLNRSFTFRGITEGVDRNSTEYLRYMLVQIGGAIINLLVFSILVEHYPAMRQQPAIPLAFGSIVAMVFNFIGARAWVYPRRSPRPE